MLMTVAERDPRSMNHMDDETRLIHSRLEAWARWARDTQSHEWPEATIIARLMEQGPVGSGQPGRPPIDMPEAIAITDSAVAALGAVDKAVVKKYYLNWEPIEVMARSVYPRMRVRQFQSVLRRARWRIGGFIDALEITAQIKLNAHSKTGT